VSEQPSFRPGSLGFCPDPRARKPSGAVQTHKNRAVEVTHTSKQLANQMFSNNCFGIYSLKTGMQKSIHVFPSLCKISHIPNLLLAGMIGLVRLDLSVYTRIEALCAIVYNREQGTLLIDSMQDIRFRAASLDWPQPGSKGSRVKDKG